MANEIVSTRRRFLGLIPVATAAAIVPTITVAQVEQSERWIEATSDNMAPLIKIGDRMLVAPVDGWDGPGIYLIDNDGCEVAYRCNRIPGQPRIHVWSENKLYGENKMTIPAFEARLRGQVVLATRRFV